MDCDFSVKDRRVCNLTGARLWDTGDLNGGHAANLLRKRWEPGAEHVKLSAYVDKKHSVPFPGLDLETHIEWTESYPADARIVSGWVTGDAPPLDQAHRAKEVATRPILLGSGTNRRQHRRLVAVCRWGHRWQQSEGQRPDGEPGGRDAGAAVCGCCESRMSGMISNSLHEAIEALSAVSYFSGLDRPTLQSVVHGAVRRDCEVGQVVFVEGEPCAGLCLVQDGWLKIVKLSPDGREQILRVVGPGEVCNEVGVFACRPNPATGIALDDATVWIIEPETILCLLDQVPGLARAITQGLAERVLHLLGLVEDLSLRTVEARLARLLLERATAGTLQRHRWATQTEMAARLGTVPDVLSRVLRKLADEGLVRVSRHQIQILDHEGLRVKAQWEG